MRRNDQSTTKKPVSKMAVKNDDSRAKSKKAVVNNKKTRKSNDQFNSGVVGTMVVLDQTPKNTELNTPPRFSDEKLNEFKDLIEKKLKNANEELSFLNGQIKKASDDGNGIDQLPGYKQKDTLEEKAEQEGLIYRANRQKEFIQQLEKALIRIENKTYGICRVTGQLIDERRLRAVPATTLSIEAKMSMAGNNVNQLLTNNTTHLYAQN